MNNLINYIEKEVGIIDGTSLEVLESFDFPLFCGCVDETIDSNDLIAKQQWAISKNGVIELKNLIPLDLLYKDGHDSGNVGALWEEHHKEFSDFILKFKPKNVLEIGGGHGKLAKNSLHSNPNLTWYIVEPNPTNKDSRIKYIDGFFNENLINDLRDKNIDCITHSHTFEHIYNPNEFLAQISFLLESNNARDIGGGGGNLMIFSLPNMEKWLINKWTNCLNFEHTLFLNENLIFYLLTKNNFRIKEKKYFYEHSIFYACEYCKNPESMNAVLINQYKHNKNIFMQFVSFYKDKIDYLNNQIKQTKIGKIYLFGAHIFSQYLLFKGLDSSKIEAILDNNKTKQNKRLYGTNLFVKSPQILKSENSLVILNVGAYNKEIKSDILENINNKTAIIEVG